MYQQNESTEVCVADLYEEQNRQAYQCERSEHLEYQVWVQLFDNKTGEAIDQKPRLALTEADYKRARSWVYGYHSCKVWFVVVDKNLAKDDWRDAYQLGGAQFDIRLLGVTNATYYNRAIKKRERALPDWVSDKIEDIIRFCARHTRPSTVAETASA